MKQRRRKFLAQCLAGLAALAFAALACAHSYRFADVDRVVVIGDVHGAFPELVSVLKVAGLIDDHNRWAGGTTHLVSLGDLLDRGARSREVMDLLMTLTDQAAAAGGQVHVVLGNHEAMNLSRELAYVAADEMAQYGDLDPTGGGDGRRGHLAAFATHGRYGRWLLSLPLVIAINDSLFLHGGVGEKLFDYSLDQINETGQADLRQFLSGFESLVGVGRISPAADFTAITQAARELAEDTNADSTSRAAASAITTATQGLPFAVDGPLWYRGNALCHPYYEENVVDRALKHFAVARIVVAHTPTADGTPHARMTGKVLRMDTGMNPQAYGGTPTALELREGQLHYYFSGHPQKVAVTESNRNWARPYGLNDAQIESFLSAAPISHIEKPGAGIADPWLLTLAQDGKKMRAVFKRRDSDQNLQGQRWGRAGDQSERFVYDYAAYRLDRMLGLEMVPPTVLRQVDGQPGMVQYLVEQTISEKDRREAGIAYQGWCSLGAQYNLMNIFDALIHNDARDPSHVLIRKSDWRLWLIDHTRAFRSARRVAKPYRDAQLDVSPQMAAALNGLTRDRLQAEFGAYLHTRQIDGLEARAKYLAKQGNP